MNAGTGGQAALAAVPPAVLVGLGAVLLGVAVGHNVVVYAVPA